MALVELRRPMDGKSRPRLFDRAERAPDVTQRPL